MQTLPANNGGIFRAKRCHFTSKVSPLNPTKQLSVSPPETNQTHLRNLEKVLRSSTNPTNVNGSATSSRTNTKNPTLLDGLRLSRIWPEMRSAVEEMSPKHLQRLQRLLSNSPEFSPKNSLGSRWRELHGSNNWVGLLDPLDENLRRELVRYGEFVQAAYEAFHSDPEQASSEPRHVALPDAWYRVTKSLYATSSVGLPSWIDNVAPELRWMTQRTSRIGYVAVCDDPREIRRMGRRDIVIALRGTATCLEWAENFRPNLVEIPEHESGSETSDMNRPRVECGFLSLYRTRGSHAPSLAETVVGEVNRLVELYKGETLSISVTGHSLGAALSLLVADDVAARVPHAPPVAVFSFGGPRVGNREFAGRLDSRNVKVLRVVNNQDVVTKVPGIPVAAAAEQGQKHNKTIIPGTMKQLVEKNNPWAYSHVGAELRVDTRMSPYLKPNADVACCHDLEAYLHLVDGFFASNCPFRANAKRSLRKLLDEQKSNVKVLYMGKVMKLNRLALDNRDGVPISSCLPSPS